MVDENFKSIGWAVTSLYVYMENCPPKTREVDYAIGFCLIDYTHGRLTREEFKKSLIKYGVDKGIVKLIFWGG